MAAVRSYTDADQHIWDRFVLASDGSHPAQLRAWLALTERTYGVACRSWICGGDASPLRGILALFEHRRRGRPPVLFSPPGGLLAADDDAARGLLRIAGETLDREGAAYVELRDQRSEWPGVATNTEHCTHVLPLCADADTQWRGFDAKLRNQIRKAQRAGFTVQWGADHLHGFYRVMLENMRDLGTPIRRERWFADVAAMLGARAAVLVLALHGEPVGAMFLVMHRGVAVDIWASSLRRHFAHCPNQLLYWEALQEAMRRGVQAFDFGRSQWNTGTFRYKQQWGAHVVPLYYQYLLPAGAGAPSFASQRSRLGLAARVWRRLPLPIAGMLGDPIRRRFPELL